MQIQEDQKLKPLILVHIENQPKSREFRRVGEPTRIFQFEKNQKGLKLWVVSREKATEVCKKQKGWNIRGRTCFQVLIYGLTSLVAEFGGTLGLFLGSVTISIKLMDIVVFADSHS